MLRSQVMNLLSPSRQLLITTPLTQHADQTEKPGISARKSYQHMLAYFLRAPGQQSESMCSRDEQQVCVTLGFAGTV